MNVGMAFVEPTYSCLVLLLSSLCKILNKNGVVCIRGRPKQLTKEETCAAGPALLVGEHAT